MSHSYFTHTLNDSILRLRRSDFSESSALVLNHGQERHLVPYQAEEGEFYSFPIPNHFLSNVKSLDALQVTLTMEKTHVDLKTHPNCPDLLACFDVDTPETFWARVSTPARPVRDEHLLGVLCKRAVLRYQNFSVYGVALCALGYRILDRQLPQDPDAAWLLEKAERMLNWRDTITPYEDARWSTSVLMLLGYYHLAQGQVPQAVRILNRMQHYRSAMRIAPLIQTNLARANMLLADYYMAQGEYNRAAWFLEDVKHIAKEGVWWSDLYSDPVTAMYKYTEFDVVLCAAKEAARVLAMYPDVQTAQHKKVIRLSDLGGYVHVLNQRGKLNHAS